MYIGMYNYLSITEYKRKYTEKGEVGSVFQPKAAATVERTIVMRMKSNNNSNY